MKMNEMFGGDFLKADDLSGRDVTLTVANIKMESVGGNDEKAKDKPIMTFRETDKRLVLNKTNAMTLTEAYGDDTAGWIAQKITLYVDTNVFFQGKRTPAIRIRELNGKPAQPNQPAQTGDIPF